MSTAHPDIAKVATLLKEAGLYPPMGGSVDDIRTYLDGINALTAQTSKPLIDERLLAFPVNGRDVPCKLYLPDSGSAQYLLVYCHGGGFRHGRLSGWDAPLRQLVRDCGVAVLSIEYALSPEYVFPTAFNEVVAILTAVIDQRAVDGLPVECFALGGDSAGANLALSAALALRDKGIDALQYLLLFYGVYSKNVSSDSWVRLSGHGGHGLSSRSMSTYWQTYLSKDESDWRVQPLHGDFDGLPKTRLVVGELDPLLDENVALSERLSAACVDASLSVLPQIIHGVIRFNEVAPIVSQLISEEAASLRRAMLKTR